MVHIFHGYFRGFSCGRNASLPKSDLPSKPVIVAAFFDNSCIRNHYSSQIKNVDLLSVVSGNHQGFQIKIFPEKLVTARHLNNCLAQVQMKAIDNHFRQK